MRKCKRKYTKKHAMRRGLPLYALIAVMLLSVLPLSGCGREAGPESVRIGSLKGPTSLGILDLMDRAEKGETKHPYEFRMAVGADELLPLMAKGELDMALIPANVAAVLYHKTEGGVCVVDINTLGVLYLVTGDEAVAGPADLKGRTICLTGKGATPEASLRYVLDRSGLGEGDYVLEYRSEATEVAALLAEDPSRVGLLPQPFATAALMQNGDLRIAIDMNAQWEQLQGGEGGGMVTGVTVVRREFLEEHEDVVEDFLEEHGSSVAAVNGDPEKGAALAVRAGIVAKEAIAAEAIPRCNLVCVTGEEMKAALSAYLEALAGFDAGLIGGALPEEDFYY